MSRVLLLVAWVTAVVAAGAVSSGAKAMKSGCPVAHNKTFLGATRMFMPPALKTKWLWVRDVADVESNCREKVCSHVGACGVMQVMDFTWNDLVRASKRTDTPKWRKLLRQSGVSHATGKPSIFDAKYNIIFGTRYLGGICKRWSGRDRMPNEIFDVCTAWYNSGEAHGIKAQTLCNDERLWDNIKPCLPQVTGRHSTETINYVDRIRARRAARE